MNQIKLAVLCTECKDILEKHDYDTQREQQEPNFRQHHHSAHELQASSTSCQICALLWNKFSEAEKAFHLGLPGASEAYWYNASISPAQTSETPRAYDLRFKSTMDENALQEARALLGFAYLDRHWKRLRLQTVEDLADVVNHESIEEDTGSLSTWHQIEAWIRNCDRAHSRCRRALHRQEWYPTRLLEIVSALESSQIKLIHTAESPTEGSYGTLSHCWGKKPMLKLLQSNMAGFSDGCSVTALPKSFRDAIHIVQKLGLRYLWIDSLCIIQDSEADWEREASTMGDVYRHSHINIVAASSSDSSGGCFYERDSLLVQPCAVKLPISPGDEKLYYCSDPNLWSAGVELAPVNQRAWVVQERWLAPRNLYFSAQQVFWECHELQACEKFPGGIRSRFSPFAAPAFKGWNLELDRISLEGSENSRLSTSNFAFQVWTKVVEAYAKGQLTYESDKLVALSGMAKTMQNLLGQRYLAGLWRDNLAYHLLWYVESAKQANGSPSRRPLVWRAPSWTWASVDGAVSMAGDLATAEDGEILIEVLEANTTPKGMDETGQVTTGRIQIRGSLKPVRCGGTAQSIKLIQTDGSEIDFSRCRPDVATELRWDESTFCMPIQNLHNESHPWLHGILVKKTEEYSPRTDVQQNKIFVRVGYFLAAGESACRAFQMSQNAEEAGDVQLSVIELH